MVYITTAVSNNDILALLDSSCQIGISNILKNNRLQTKKRSQAKPTGNASLRSF